MAIKHYGYLKPVREMMQSIITLTFADLLSKEQEKNPDLDYVLRNREDVPKDLIPDYVIYCEKELGYYFVCFESKSSEKNVYDIVKWSGL